MCVVYLYRIAHSHAFNCCNAMTMSFHQIDCTRVWIEGSVSSSTDLLECQRTDGTWGTVCKTGFHWETANAVCKQLGYDKSSNYKTA